MDRNGMKSRERCGMGSVGRDRDVRQWWKRRHMKGGAMGWRVKGGGIIVTIRKGADKRAVNRRVGPSEGT